MTVVIQQIINGLATGGIYALIAIGWTTVFGIVGIINWTHGEVYMLGAYTGFFLTTFAHMSARNIPKHHGGFTSTTLGARQQLTFLRQCRRE